MRKSRKAPREQTREKPTTDNANVYKLQRSTRNARRVEMIPRNTAQETYIDHLFNDDKRIVFAIGPAGTGKSYLGATS